MTSQTILDSGLYVRGDFGDTGQLNAKFAADLMNAGRVASLLLLYDCLAIPTLDFGIVHALHRWFGLPLLREVLDSKSLKFVRRQILGYAGNGLGISAFKILVPPDRPWWSRAMFADIESAVLMQVENQCDRLPMTERSALVNAVIQNTVDCSPENNLFMSHVVHETYKDILASSELTNSIRDCVPKSDIDLVRLPNIGPAQLRVSSGEHIPGDPAEIVLEVAELNLDLLAANEIGDADFVSSQDAYSILRGKINRCIPGTYAVDGFMKP